MILENVETQLAKLVIGAQEMQDVYWVQNDDTGGGTEGDYCNKCAHCVAEWYSGGIKPNDAGKQMISDYSDGKSFSVYGTTGYMEDDEPRWCLLCGVELAISILTGDQEISHWEDTKPDSPESWRILQRLFYLYKPYLVDKRPYDFQNSAELLRDRNRTARLMWILRKKLLEVS